MFQDTLYESSPKWYKEAISYPMESKFITHDNNCNIHYLHWKTNMKLIDLKKDALLGLKTTALRCSTITTH